MGDAKYLAGEPPITEDEVAEYRRLRPELLKMMAEWRLVRSAKGGCPVFREIIDPTPPA